MSVVSYIDKKRVLSQAQNYEFLRAEGQKYIESLSHKLWTDFNAHDPGITILEVLCYAITELGYRSNFDIEDLLANDQGVIDNKTFFKASEILTNAPLTPIDYRKVLIDIEGVNNAWLSYSNGTKDALDYSNPLDNEIPVFINPREDKLSLKSVDRFDNTLNRLKIRGLNKIIVELGEDIDLGQLNEVEIQDSFSIEELGVTRFVATDIALEFDNWKHQKTAWLNLMSNPLKIKIKTIVIDENTVSVTVHKKSNPTHTLTLKITVVDPLETSLVETYFNDIEHITDTISKFNAKKQIVDGIYAEIDQILNDNRNFTEDWLCIETIDTIDIGVCADIHINTSADAEAVLAKIQQAIDLILNPPIRFYTLNQMLDKDLSPEQIFNGPSLSHGFLLDEEVEKSQLPECIHASDIIAALMSIDGVLAVDNMLLTAYDKLGQPLESAMNKPWCLQLNGQQKPVFSFNKSKLLMFRDGIPFIIPESGAFELSDGVFYLKTDNNTYKLKGAENDFTFPKGQYFQLDDYHSIQNDFPVTYGIGKGHLLGTEPVSRKIKAKQLKAYLQHFDQLLADFFKQLFHAKDLLDINTIDRTYFVQKLKNISGIDEDLFADEVYSATFETTLFNGQNEDDRSHYENDKLFFDRRNRFLDHLMARFGESFSDYVFMMHTMQENANGLAEITLQDNELIHDKEQFIAKYPQLSYPRGLGMNYLQEHSVDIEHPWGISERGGFENRIAALLGINTFTLSDIVDDQPKSFWTYNTVIGPLSFSLPNTNTFTLNERWELAHMLINNVSAYRVVTFANSFIYFVNSDHIKIAKFEKAFNSVAEAEEFIPKLYQALNSYLENFYCIEHILLRPLIDNDLTDDDLLTVCLNDDCYSEANNDPYSFKATVILPGWLSRFRNRYFRNYAETLMRSEAPAHTLLKICWVGRDDMIGFQNAYKAWLIEYKKLRTKYCLDTLSLSAKKAYNKKLSNLIAQLKRLNTIYDEGTLHDCLESELTNPISLNNSSLGTLKNIEP
ncbi:hypothetical protein [uncultured Psychroserpens sp.]|uniref:hypothetical protein n=1 Tax=uncultured Psychroserpens sp. TaxID=255436 RepID=UPI0026020F9C|nr:hypothetical protein [uncultured Psychroserpens sp.]